MLTMPLEIHAATLVAVLDSALATCPCGRSHSYAFTARHGRLYALIGPDAIAVQADGHNAGALADEGNALPACPSWSDALN
jgi:hypothetical protein